MKPDTSFTASSSFLIADAISLIVSRKVFLSVISSGIRLRIFFNAHDFLFNSWKASSDLFSLYSTASTSEAAPWSLKILSFILTLSSPCRIMPTTKSYAKPGFAVSVLDNAARRVCEAWTSRFSSCDKIGLKRTGSMRDVTGDSSPMVIF
uniref:Uncharacterized protein n=1 Tax=Cacopsylla melanoneura TaxID=428564 RepID=A0A8D8R7J1_9HEMI